METRTTPLASNMWKMGSDSDDIRGRDRVSIQRPLCCGKIHPSPPWDPSTRSRPSFSQAGSRLFSNKMDLGPSSDRLVRAEEFHGISAVTLKKRAGGKLKYFFLLSAPLHPSVGV
ncbi:uncharacterized protein BDW47DRAFT_105587 [Aspergillus candidus]|uniref:Uncharacterized protein n=1 Tax=Aspergillus candidus TaxID=41067 RepID=A0A2I2FCA1_ASPCN|nr:hypothetical protein BDW47DRAFT_105587 [Aspergillus candidus]PLB38259.1 hypothetical protein BDW47DRAFT_105587 [Aspergillus candidus]